MKKIIATLAVIFSLTTSATFAYDGSSVSKAALKSFNKEFSGAVNASWAELPAGLYRVSFEYNGKEVNAFFDADGNIIATGREITEEQLPLVVSKSLDTKYAGFAKTDIIEYTMDGETQYLAKVENGDKSYLIKAAGNGDLQVYKKEKK